MRSGSRLSPGNSPGIQAFSNGLQLAGLGSYLWEIGNVLIQAERRGRITMAAIRTFLILLERLPIEVDHPTTAHAWHSTLALARSHQLTSYDAAYLELALRLGLS